MNYVACMEQVGAEIRRRLAEPGVLRGRQRSPAFINGVVTVGLFVARHHALADFDHIFPLARMKIHGMMQIPEWLIRRAIPVLRSIGFIDLDREIVRRIHSGTKSLTEGSNPAWYCPGQYTLDPRIRFLFGKRAGPRLAPPPLENQCDQDVISNLQRKEEGQEEDFSGSVFLVALTPEPTAVAAAPAPSTAHPVPSVVPRVPLPTGLSASISRALAVVANPPPKAPVVAPAVPMQRTRIPLPPKMAAAISHALNVVKTKPTPVPFVGDLARPARVEGDRRFERDFPTVFRLIPSKWPKVFDEVEGDIRPEVYEWLAEHSGMPGRGHGMRWFEQNDVPGWLRNSGLTPAELFDEYEVERDMRLGFRDEAMAFEFRMRWGGL